MLGSPLWVIRRDTGSGAACALYPRKPTSRIHEHTPWPDQRMSGRVARVLACNAIPELPDHVLHDQRILPAVREFRAVRPGDGVGRRTQFTQEGEDRIGLRAAAP